MVNATLVRSNLPPEELAEMGLPDCWFLIPDDEDHDMREFYSKDEAMKTAESWGWNITNLQN